MKQPNPRGAPAGRLELGPLTDAGRRLAQDVARVAPRLERADLAPEDARAQLDAGTRLLAQGRAADALGRLERATALDPRDADARHRLGQALIWLGREPEAIAVLQRAVALAPRHAEALLDLGELQLQCGDPDAADASFARAGAAAASEAVSLRARIWRHWCDGSMDQAEAPLRRLRALEPRRARTLELLGYMLSHVGRFAEADAVLREGIGGDGPGAGAAALHLVTIRPATEADRPLIAALAARLNRDRLPVPVPDRMLLHFAIAKLHDDLGEYAQAMPHYHRANDLRWRQYPLGYEAVRAQVDRLIAMFPRGSLDTATGGGTDDARPVFILGLPRSGTTLAEQILSSHPQVAAGGELVFWGGHGATLLREAAPDRAALSALAMDYLAELDRIAGSAPRVTDKNPFNFWWIGFLRLALPKARFVMLRRDPLDTCVSLYTTYMSWRDTFFVGNQDHLVAWHRETSRLLRHWQSVLPADALLLLDYEALILDRERQTRRLLEFCGLPWNDACLQPHANSRKVGTASIWQARQPVYSGSIGRWRRYAPWLGPLAQLAAGVKPGSEAELR